MKDEILKRISELSPEKRKLLDRLLNKKGLASPHLQITNNQPSSGNSKYSNIFRLSLTEFQQSTVSRKPFFLIHPGEGNISCYSELAVHIGKDFPVYCFQALGFNEGEKPYTKIEDMAAHYINSMQSIQDEGPYILGGWSMGGLIAYEMAQQLLRQDKNISMLVVFDTWISVNRHYVKEGAEALLQNLFPNLKLSLDEIDHSSDNYSDYFTDEELDLILENAKKSNFISSEFGVAQVERYFKVFKTNAMAMLAYKPDIYQGSMIIFRAKELLTDYDPVIEWSNLVSGGIEIYSVPGHHFTMLKEPNVQELSRQLREVLSTALE